MVPRSMEDSEITNFSADGFDWKLMPEGSILIAFNIFHKNLRTLMSTALVYLNCEENISSGDHSLNAFFDETVYSHKA